MRIRRVGTALSLALIVTLGAAAQTNEARVLLEAARRIEMVDGNLPGAIAKYQEIVDKYGKTERAIAADALLRVAGCFERRGDPRAARTAYEQIAREYGEQPQAAVAQARLARDGKAARMTFVKVWDGDASTGNVSATGRLTYAGGDFPNRMFVHDLATGTTASITAESTDGRRNALGGVISKDGRRVVYTSCTDDSCELRIVSVRMDVPQESQVLVQGSSELSLYPLDWSPDASLVAVRVGRPDRTSQLGLVTVPAGSLTILKSLDWRGVRTAFFSPDGRSLLYDMPADEAGSQRDVFVVTIDGAQGTAAVSHPADDTAMGWSSDGRFVMFASDRTGTRDLWMLPVSNARPRGSPQLAMPNIGNGVALGTSSSGSLYLGLRRGGGPDIEIANVDLASARVTKQPTRPIQSYLGANSQPAWSPDGKSLAYLSRRGNRREVALMVHSFDGRPDREIPLAPALGWFIAPTWSPDGRQFAVVGNDLKGRHGVFRIDAATGVVTPVTFTKFASPGENSERLTYEGVGWSPDGSRLYYHKAGGDILEFTLATASERRVAEGAYGPISLSPDGRWIATYRMPSRSDAPNTRPAMVIIPVHGGEPREVWHLSRGEWFNNTAMAWTPDGRAVLVRRMMNSTGSQSELWIVPSDGTSPQRLDFDATRIATYAPGKVRLSPDGRQIAFQAVGENASEVWMLSNFIPAAQPASR